MSSSSSSGYVSDDWAPDARLRSLVSFDIEHADGSVEPITTPALWLHAGANVQWTPDPNSDTLALEMVPGGGADDPYYRQKYLALMRQGPLSGPYPDAGGNTPIGDDWSFSDASQWIATFNGMPPEQLTGVFFLLGSDCTAFGQFLAGGVPEADEHTLRVLDICLPCVDCLTWERLDQYLQRISLFYNYLNRLANNPTPTTPVTHPDTGAPAPQSGLLQQTVATLRYWDYLVHRSTVKLSVQAQGQSIVIAGFYRNISASALGTGPGVTFTFACTFYYRVVGTTQYCPWRGISDQLVTARQLSRQGVFVASLSTTAYGNITPPGGCTTVLAHNDTITLTLAGHGAGAGLLAPGEELFADAALLVASLDTFIHTGYEFMVQVQMSVSPVHMAPGTLSRTEMVYFLPNAPTSSSSSA